MMSKRLFKLGLACLALLVAVFAVLRLTAIGHDLGALPAIERPWLLPAAVIGYAATLLLLALAWREIVCRIEDARPPVIDSVAVFCASWVGRYVPSSLPYIAGKLVMGGLLGHSRSALAASVVYENLIVVCVGATGASVFILALLTGAGGPLVFASSAVGGAAGLLLLSPPVVRLALRLASRLTNRALLPEGIVLSYRGMLIAATISGVALIANGWGFACLLGSFTGMTVREAIAAGAIYNLAGVAGIAALPLPSGLGVREAVLIGLLQVFVPVPIAVAAAVLARLIGLVIDLVFGTLGAGTLAIRQRSVTATPTALVEQRTLDAA